MVARGLSPAIAASGHSSISDEYQVVSMEGGVVASQDFIFSANLI
jgi:hypothetical protein